MQGAPVGHFAQQLDQSFSFPLTQVLHGAGVGFLQHLSALTTIS